VYRADSKDRAEDLRLMELVHRVVVPTPDCPNFPGQVCWTDAGRPGLVTFYYRVVAVDRDENVSKPSSAVAARAYDLARAEPPAWNRAEWVTLEDATSIIRLSWSVGEAGTQCIVQRSNGGSSFWRAVSDWISQPFDPLDPLVYRFDDVTAQPRVDYQYRIKVINPAGNTNAAFNTIYVGAREA
jgi:hypothetical protein